MKEETDFQAAHASLHDFLARYLALIQYALEMGVSLQKDRQIDLETGYFTEHPSAKRGSLDTETERLGSLCETLRLLDDRASEKERSGHYPSLPNQALAPLAESVFYSHYTLTAARAIVAQYLQRHVHKEEVIENLYSELAPLGFVSVLPDYATIKEQQGAVWDGFYDMLDSADREMEILKRHAFGLLFPEYKRLIRSLPPRERRRVSAHK